MPYTVKEIFYTLQGEGGNAGRPAVFLRFAGCNLWSGRKEDRAKACCKFCDTDFVGGTKYETAGELADAVVALWPKPHYRFCVITGGEPALQFDGPLLTALHERDFFVAMETNGTIKLKADPDWITVSPKTMDLRVTSGDELKLVYPQAHLPPELFEKMMFLNFYLQPMDKRFHRKANTKAAIGYCQSHPKWRLSLQTHKILGLR